MHVFMKFVYTLKLILCRIFRIRDDWLNISKWYCTLMSAHGLYFDIHKIKS